jgi:serine/threonine protein kinase
MSHLNRFQTNVLINSDGELSLADFGLNDSCGITNSTFNSCYAGNVRWMAPEMLAIPEEGGVTMPTKAADIYSYDCIMLQVCCPFDSTYSTDVAQLFSGQPPYSWLMQAMHVIVARVGGKEPFPAHRITNVEDDHKKYSLGCLSTTSEIDQMSPGLWSS